MASITEATLSISHDHEKKTARAVVKCKVRFTEFELCQMKTCRGRQFKLKCQLWGEDTFWDFGSLFDNSDNKLFTYSDVFYFPDGTPAALESRTFDVLLGEGVLDEDSNQDEIYGRVVLQNLYTLTSVARKTNVVHHSF